MLTRFLIYFTIFILFFNCEFAFASGPWKGKIIDTETKEPLEGAVVVAFWRRVWRTPAGGNSYIYEVKEVVTDKEGRFEIPSYTPINLLLLVSYMKGPEFVIFKPGYGSLQMVLENYLFGGALESKEMELSGKKYRLTQGTIELPPLKKREEREKINVSPVGDSKWYWKKQKQFIKAIREEWQHLYGEDPSKLYRWEDD